MKILKHVSVGILLSSFSFMAACEKQAPTEQNSANANRITNENVSQNTYLINSESFPAASPPKNDSAALNKNMSENTNTKTLSESLKQQLKHDNENLLLPEDWDKDVWLEVEIGPFYKYQDDFIKDAVCKVTNEFLKPGNKRLTETSQRRLRKKIKSDVKCKNVVAEMKTAALSTEPIIIEN